ncbi:carboxylating nicotinate-nucleotide diphosphorylase [Candidatus Bathyarchaeota archaeon]|nr:MAG: nicotinate-nucleotide diphosphorylase (carboxylating) [archaeon 13_1_20CM_2_51_12]TMI40793.1 MAG: carboxylating nicotinate-nucleotide diphosphorylase [Candidatus Bathyarchaeota archaeon]
MVENAIRSFLAEDLGYGDITTNVLVDSERKGEGRVVCRENAVIAGIEEAVILLELVGCQGTAKTRDGGRVKAGTMILSARGPARALLGVERTLLNLLSHMSGVATSTADLVSIANKESRDKIRIACTRKTLPGLRYFEKRAVELGGGDTHRLRLDDAVLIKDNHLELAGSVGACVRKAKERVSFTRKVEVEVTNPDQAVEAAEAGADIVLLDNMTPKEVASSVSLLMSRGLRDRVLVETSGGIRRENLASYARTGVDVISVGAITHSAPAVDVSLEIHASRKGG